MNKTDLSHRDDIARLVTAFYDRIRADVYLGPIFNKHIQDWEAHLCHLTDFWEHSLFLKGNYTGNPLKAHESVDAAQGYQINEQHFGIWLNHWSQTIDSLYQGPQAEILKLRARKMATHIHIHIFKQRPQG